MNTMTTYAIHEDNMPRLQKKLTTIANKCRKYGCTFSFKEVGEEYRTLKDVNGNEYNARFVLVQAEGTAVMNDWQFVATVTHTEEGNLIQSYEGIEVPDRYYNSKPVCEHCNCNRVRKDTYIVRNTVTGEFKQVGKSCLKDFTHGLSAAGVAQYISLYDALIVGETPVESSHTKRYISTREALQICCETVNKYGYFKATEENFYKGTGDRAFEFYRGIHNISFSPHHEDVRTYRAEMERVKFDPDRADVVAKVDEVLAWIEAQPETNNYFHNLKVVCANEYVVSGWNLLCSVFAAHNKELERAAEKAAKAAKEKHSTYQGQLKQRLTIKGFDSIRCLTSWETMYGTTYLFKFTDLTGNVYTWKTSKALYELDDLYSYENVILTGTVKEHTEYRGVQQTELTRCKVEVMK